MTIDITIGKIVRISLDEVLEQIKDDNYTVTHEQVITANQFFDVEICKPEDDGCTRDDTIHPGEAYRSGSIFSISEFFTQVLGDVGTLLRPIGTNDKQITILHPIIDRINAVEYKGDDKYHKMRLHWLKFWCNKAIEQFGNEAGIEFT